MSACTQEQLYQNTHYTGYDSCPEAEYREYQAVNPLLNATQALLDVAHPVIRLLSMTFEPTDAPGYIRIGVSSHALPRYVRGDRSSALMSRRGVCSG